ncbi:putative ribonuclease H-like domain-containing protein, partial [Tanacetum coccineum]
DESNKWHRRLGHVNFKNLNKLVKGNLVRGLPSKIFQNDHTCVACQKGKQHKASCKAKSVSSISQPLQLLHMDLFGPTSVRSINHKTYCLVITDDFSRFSWVFFLRTKDETSGILKDFIRQIENQLNKKVKTIRCDNGTEFKNRDMIEFCGSKGIKREYSNARTPQQNGVAERKNRTLIEAARTLLAYSFLPRLKQLALLVIYIRPFGCHVTILNTINHLGKFDGKSDEGFLVGYSLNSKDFKPVRSENQANKHAGPKEANHIAGTQDNIDAGNSEMEAKSIQDYFVLPIWSSYTLTFKSSEEKNEGDKSTKNTDLKTNEKSVDQEDQAFLDELERLKREKKEANDAAEALRKEFAQNTEDLLLHAGATRASSTNTVNIASTSVSTASPSGGLSFTHLTNTDQDDSEIPDLEDSYDNPNDGIFTNASYDDEGAVVDFTNLETTVNVSPIPTSRINFIHPSNQILGDPKSAVQTRSKVNKSSGAHAFKLLKMKVGLMLCKKNYCSSRYKKVWILVDLPYGKKAIGTKWVYRNKKDERGVVVRNKSRLVAQGHRQEEGIDYDEVFAPVARIEAIRIFLAFASYMGFIVYQMDVKSAFLYGKIDEEVYVSQPPGFLDPKYPQKVYKVVKALYGLHQAPRAWYATLSTFLLKNGYRRGTIDKTLFIKKDKHDIILVQVYVDDIIFGSTKKSWCDEFEALMKSRFQMSSMGELTFFLGLQVKQKADGIFISQDKYVAEILKKFDFANVKTASTPIETQKPLVKDEEASDVDVHLYRSMIGSLMYLTASRPDIMFAVCACSRFQVTPKSSHLSAVKRIFRYLKGKPKLGLWYPRVSSFDLESYSDSDYAGENLDRKSTTGGCQFLGRRLISWQCKKQTIVATSTTEAEYVAAASCCGQVLWIQNQMLDYGFNFMNTKIYIDNESTICIVKNPVYHSKTKHIAIRHHFIRDAYEKKLIQVLKIHTDDNVADLLTKAFDVSRESLRRALDGTEALMLPKLFIHWLATVSTDSAELVPMGKTTMAVLESCPKHNMVAYLEKTDGNAEFHEIIDFLTRSSIHHALTGKHFSGKVTPLFASMLVQPTEDEGAPSEDHLKHKTYTPLSFPAHTSEVPFEPHSDSSPAHTSEVPIEQPNDPSPRPSPSTIIPDSIPETSGGNIGGHSSSDNPFRDMRAPDEEKEVDYENTFLDIKKKYPIKNEKQSVLETKTTEEDFEGCVSAGNGRYKMRFLKVFDRIGYRELEAHGSSGSEEDSTMALELIRFIKKLLTELESEDFDGDEEDL